MSLTTTIGAGSLIGAVAAFAVYAAASPNEDAVAAPVAPVAASISPVPTPTLTQTADGCEPPAVLTGGECVLTTPGRTVVVPAPTGSVDAWDDSDGRVDGSDDRDDDSFDAWDDSDGRDDHADDRDDDDRDDSGDDHDDDRDDDHGDDSDDDSDDD